jgi:hypothetical protein
MTRDSLPMLLCDGDNGWCGASTTDWYEQAASLVGGKARTSAPATTRLRR